ncbi:MAG: peptidase M61, partial [Sphingomonas sp.]|nr:peptidase M61 [Sphingomonas sp.]
LFGTQHYDNYHFLLSISDRLGGIGLEHHRSSEDGVGLGYFTEWEGSAPSRSLLPHEFSHSWNGKYRRPADLWTPDYRTPMRGSLLWVYEGQTTFWGNVLAARAGLMTKQETLDAIAVAMEGLDATKGRDWRSLADTTTDPVIAYSSPKAWGGWQRGKDYYPEGMAVWLEVDNILRRQSGDTKSIDDFARAFYSGTEGDWGAVTYSFDDVVATLHRIVPLYDWRQALLQRLNETGASPPFAGLIAGGYRLVYRETPNAFTRASEKQRKRTDLSSSVGLVIGRDGEVANVTWDSAAFKAGLVVGETIMSVDGVAYSPEVLKTAITTAKTDNRAAATPILLIVKQGDRVEERRIDYHGGLRYPHLAKIGTGEGGLDRLLTAK